MLKGILPGDNIVWQVDTIEDYLAFATPYCEAARRWERRLIYFRFAKHEPLLPTDFGAEVHELHPELGFEAFMRTDHRVIKEAARAASTSSTSFPTWPPTGTPTRCSATSSC